MRMIIRGVREARQPFIDYLTKELPAAEWCFDQKRCDMDTMVRALRMAGDDGALHMEDDIILCPDFTRKAQEVVAARPGDVVQLFSMRKADLTQGSRWDREFCMTQCFYLPPGMSQAIADYYEAVFSKEWEYKPGYCDHLIYTYFKANSIRFWIHVPSLVDHRVTKSVAGPGRSSKRQSLTFGQHSVPAKPRIITAADLERAKKKA